MKSLVMSKWSESCDILNVWWAALCKQINNMTKLITEPPCYAVEALILCLKDTVASICRLELAANGC